MSFTEDILHIRSSLCSISSRFIATLQSGYYHPFFPGEKTRTSGWLVSGPTASRWQRFKSKPSLFDPRHVDFLFYNFAYGSLTTKCPFNFSIFQFRLCFGFKSCLPFTNILGRWSIPFMKDRFKLNWVSPLRAWWSYYVVWSITTTTWNWGHEK